jgi:hypothetical protein
VSEVKIASTTDSAEQVNQAAEMLESDNLIQPAEEGSGGEGKSSFEATENWVGQSGPRVASTTDSEEAVAETQQDLDEDREQKKEEYLGKTRRRQQQTIVRLHSEVDKRDQRINELEQKLGAQNEQPQSGEARQEPTPEELQRQRQWQAAQLEARVALPYKLQIGQQKYTDFDESINSVSNDHPLPSWTIEAMKLMPNTADVMYWLSKHSDHMDELLRLDRAGQGPQAMRLLDQISGGLAIGELHTAPRGPQRSGHRAPPPIEHVRGGSAVTHRALDDPSVSYAEFKRRRDAGEGR